MQEERTALSGEQLCICSVGVDRCPAHPYKPKRERKPKPSRQGLRPGQCPACVFIREGEHDGKRHSLYVGDVRDALTIGPVFCRIPQLSPNALIVRGVCRKEGVLAVEVLEGEFTGVPEIWMDAPA